MVQGTSVSTEHMMHKNNEAGEQRRRKLFTVKQSRTAAITCKKVLHVISRFAIFILTLPGSIGFAIFFN
jgi:hypothetical protein